MNHSRHWKVITQTSYESNKTKSQLDTSKSNDITLNSTGIAEGITSSDMEESLKRSYSLSGTEGNRYESRNKSELPKMSESLGKSDSLSGTEGNRFESESESESE